MKRADPTDDFDALLQRTLKKINVWQEYFTCSCHPQSIKDNMWPANIKDNIRPPFLFYCRDVVRCVRTTKYNLEPLTNGFLLWIYFPALKCLMEQFESSISLFPTNLHIDVWSPKSVVVGIFGVIKRIRLCNYLPIFSAFLRCSGRESFISFHFLTIGKWLVMLFICSNSSTSTFCIADF